ncbi:tryptophan 7-halogenase [Roseateles asaccharophilus]|uniref:Tryptophan halogenase n=1 Tax=Roseateles asaccharophilus TaxID=582607 RepID=A0ABU2A9N3_9BURK|nr:tryptophan 7-halogenase [Roseateles asaccharophilus]MDR7333911.1 tryptophan halogenase [Roseateles asaccharophilus]
MKTRRIAILGGGTAGWLAANHLGYELHADPDVQITVIESADVPIIGVGEGTVPAIKTSLRKFGISEADLIVACDTTFKNGIKFQGWRDPARHGERHFYYHPFASPFPAGLDITPSWLEAPDARPFSDVSISTRVAEAGRCPKRIESAPYVGDVDYAYHVNAHKFAALLSANAQRRFGVRHHIATIVDAERDESGAITALKAKDGERLPFDFYVDCSGFASLLVHRHLKVPFVDKSHQILTDTALVQQVPLAGAEIPPYTLAQAHEAGWIWDIPVTQRRGTGFVYASAFMSEAQAVQGFARYLGVPPDSLSPRKIAMKIGYRQQAWVHNCAALGLAQGFVEPLEATSILVTDFAANLLSRNFPRQAGDAHALRGGYNEAVAYTWERIIDFVQLHYHLSDRTDSDFWRENRRADHLSDLLRERLARWAVRHPLKSDFASRFDLFDVDNHLYVLYGMGFATRPLPISADERRESLAQFGQVAQQAQAAIHGLPGHREWLDGLRAAYQP